MEWYILFSYELPLTGIHGRTNRSRRVSMSDDTNSMGRVAGHEYQAYLPIQHDEHDAAPDETKYTTKPDDRGCRRT